MGGVGSGGIEGKRQRCSRCRNPGHKATSCKKAEASAKSRKKDAPVKPDKIVVGDRFIVVEDLEEADPRDGGPWTGGTVFEAMELLGEREGYEEWRLRAHDFPEPGCWFESVGFPQLHPFLRCPPPGASMNVPRVGMQVRMVVAEVEEPAEPEPVAFDPGDPRRANPLGFRRPRSLPALPPDCLVMARTGRPCLACRPAVDDADILAAAG